MKLKKFWIESLWDCLQFSFSCIADLHIPHFVLDTLPLFCMRIPLHCFQTDILTGQTPFHHFFSKFLSQCLFLIFRPLSSGDTFWPSSSCSLFCWGLLCSGSSSEPWEASSAWNGASSSDFSSLSLSSSSSSSSDSSFFPFSLVRCDVLRLEVAFQELGRFESAGVSTSSPASWKVQNLGKLWHEYVILLCSFSKSKLLKHRMLLFQQRTQETKLRHLFNC